jgi:hypothetical protein
LLFEGWAAIVVGVRNNIALSEGRVGFAVRSMLFFYVVGCYYGCYGVAIK